MVQRTSLSIWFCLSLAVVAASTALSSLTLLGIMRAVRNAGASGLLSVARGIAEANQSMLVRAGDVDALYRVNQHHPHFRKSAQDGAPRTTFSLADAQWVIAREHGFESWPKFAKHLGDAIDGPGGGNTATVVETQLEITTAEINLCTFMRDGRRATTSAEGNSVRLWDVRAARI